MSSLERWQYVYLLLALLLFGLAAIGYVITGISVFTLYPIIVCLGIVFVVVRPMAFGYIMAGFGVMSLAIAGFLVQGEASLLTKTVLVVIGLGTLIGGIRTHRTRSINQ